MAPKTQVQPDVAIHPGEILADELEARTMTQVELARQMGRPVQAINEIINGKKAITAETALQLEQALKTPAHVWLNLQAQYELIQARLAQRPAPAPGRASLSRYVRVQRGRAERSALIAKKTFTGRRVAKKK